jgi:hypothetical protein
MSSYSRLGALTKELASMFPVLVSAGFSTMVCFYRTKPRKTTVEKPWYDVSDEEADIAGPDHITSIITLRSSDDDTF